MVSQNTRRVGYSNLWQVCVIAISSILVFLSFFLLCSQCWNCFKTEPAKEVEEKEEDKGKSKSKRKKRFGKRRKRSKGSGGLIINMHGAEDEDFQTAVSLGQSEIQPLNNDAYYQPTRSKSLGDRAKQFFKAFQTTMIQPNQEEIIIAPKPPKPSLTRISEHVMQHINVNEEIIGNVGAIYFKLTYDLYEQLFTVYIDKAEGLEAKDIGGSSDPFVRVLLLPDKKREMKTNVKKKTLNPEWQEALKFEGYPKDVLMNRVLYLQVLDYDRFSRPDPIGDIRIKLTEKDLHPQAVQYMERLRPDKSSAQNHQLGDILISLSYAQMEGRMSVTIKKCRNLKAMDVTGKCDPYVRINVYYSNHCTHKRKTETIRRSLNPEWNEKMDFDLPFNKARDVMFVFTVMDFEAVFSDKPVGEIVLGSKMQGQSQQHWHEVLCYNKKTVEHWHKLQKPVDRSRMSLRF